MTSPTNSQELAQQLQTELAQAEYEPLLPIENALILWSLGIGVLSLSALAFLK